MGRVCVCRWQEKCGRLPSQKSIPGHWSHVPPAALSWIDCELLTGNLNMALISVWTHIIFVWHVCRFYWKFTFLGHSGNFFVHLCWVQHWEQWSWPNHHQTAIQEDNNKFKHRIFCLFVAALLVATKQPGKEHSPALLLLAALPKVAQAFPSDIQCQSWADAPERLSKHCQTAFEVLTICFEISKNCCIISFLLWYRYFWSHSKENNNPSKLFFLFSLSNL